MTMVVHVPPEVETEIQTVVKETGVAPFANLSFGESHRGLVVADELYEGMLEAFNLLEYKREVLKEYVDMVFTTVIKRPQTLPEGVSIRGWTGEYAEDIVKGLSEAFQLVSSLGYQRLCIRMGESADQCLADLPEVFYVIVPTRKTDDGFSSLTRYFEMTFPGPFASVPKETVPLCDDSATVGAVLEQDNVIRLLMPLAEFNDGVIVRLITRLLQQLVAPRLQGGDAFRVFCAAQRAQYDRGKSEKFLDLLWGDVKREISLLEKDAKEKRRCYEEQLELLAEARRNLKNAEDTLCHSSNFLEEQRVKIAKQYQQVIKIPKVREAIASSGCLSVYTDELIALDTSTGLYHSIGEFKIDLFLQATGSDSPVVWHNFTRTIKCGTGHIIAANISVTGKPCWGDFEHSLPTAIRQLRLYDAVTMAIDLVERVNIHDGWGKRVKLFPVVEVEVVNGVVRRKAASK